MGKKSLWEVRKVKKTTKIVSALLVLVLMMAQIVCVNAATTAYVSISATQTDHFEKTVTASFTNASKVTKVYVGLEDADGKRISTEEHTFDNVTTFSLSVKVRPTEVSKVLVTYYDNGEEVKKTFTVGPNGYYDINAGSGSSSNGVYDGLINSGSSGSSWNGSSNSGSNVWEYYDPNAWHGYYEETRKDTTTYFVTCRTLNVRKGAGTSYGKVGTLSRNTAVEVYSIEKGWAVIEFNGHLRYVSAKYLSK